MRLAGTARQYLKKAMLQLTGMTIHTATPGNSSWPYQANVMNTFEQSKSRIGRTYACVITAPSAPKNTLVRVGGEQGCLIKRLDDVLAHLLGVAEQHHSVVAIEQLVLDTGIA